MRQNTDLRKTALVTGATGGIGKAIAERMARMGMDLFLTGRRETELLLLQDALKEYGVSMEIFASDLENEMAPETIMAAYGRTYETLDVLINNAGIAISKSVEETDPGDWDRLMRVNARAPFFLCKAALSLLRKPPAGIIINISSVVGRLGYPMQSAYGASKHALIGFSKALAKEVQKDNIRVHVIAPGGVDTALVQGMRPDLDREALIRPDEISDVVEFLIRQKGLGVIDEINIRRVTGTPWA